MRRPCSSVDGCVNNGTGCDIGEKEEEVEGKGEGEDRERFVVVVTLLMLMLCIVVKSAPFLPSFTDWIGLYGEPIKKNREGEIRTNARTILGTIAHFSKTVPSFFNTSTAGCAMPCAYPFFSVIATSTHPRALNSFARTLSVSMIAEPVYPVAWRVASRCCGVGSEVTMRGVPFEAVIEGVSWARVVR